CVRGGTGTLHFDYW
nr:immunoglobulin heavy chain junction region [Mus musculus]